MERMDKSNKELADDPFLLASWICLMKNCNRWMNGERLRGVIVGCMIESLAGKGERQNKNILWLLIKLPVGRGTRED